MSDNNIPTPEATTPAPVTVATKAPKSKGLSIYNRVALVLLLVLVPVRLRRPEDEGGEGHEG